MNKLIVLGVAMIAFVFSMNAQDISENAIGLRFGDNDGLGAEISYQRGLGDNNRLEFDLGWRNSSNFDAFKLTGLYQWIFPLDGSFNWYVGAGGGLASFSGKKVLDGESETALFAAGDIGVEYNFDIPLLLSLDFRPGIGFGDFDNDLNFDIALGIRYQF